MGIDWPAIRRFDWAAIGGVALRNAVPIVGMIVSGFGAGEILLLYYIDTLAGLATVFALVMMFARGIGVDASTPRGALNIAFSTALLTAIFAFVCAMPLVVAAATSGIDWQSDELRLALLVQLLFASTAFLTMSGEMRRRPEADRDARLKARFGFVFARWIAVFAVSTAIPWAPLLVLAYVVASAWLEIRPLPPDEPASAPSSVEATRSPPGAPAGSRRRRRRGSR